ncbi:heat shock protein SSA1, putative [Entamoeba invadens IP1]|uniref:Heat shock protein SSA1, putative n=1 Tax=Entamoeba invadens IP1 TaxID=370355 RepID=A0A0A1U291_ENTIV|nr:heat shock protein SSA1, putative [Entamoeba invadens IP1]ELP86753.1 heat shock protein SSA1, putative [Entamoeba invadens IP1]|eukprot:XP_004186099.1 heat shock protein SSA1, putative [Entamoeba invadens IP1]
MEVILGIDLGTTYSCVKRFNVTTQEVESVIFSNRDSLLRSTVNFDNGQIVVGGTPSSNCFCDVKRLIGLKMTDTEILPDLQKFSFGVEAKENNEIVLILQKRNDETYKCSPEELTAVVLYKLKMSSLVGLPPTTPVKAVITVPSQFIEPQLLAVEFAAKMAGITVIRLEREPTAAFFAYKQLKYSKEDLSHGTMTVLVFDFGGGTLDVSIVEMSGARTRVKATCGNNHLGGLDIDEVIKQHVLDELKVVDEETYTKLCVTSSAERKRQRMKTLALHCEEAKIKLFSNDVERCLIEPFEEVDFQMVLERHQVEKWCEVVFEECMVVVRKCLAKARLDKHDIDRVLAIGGSSKIDKIKEMLYRETSIVVEQDVDPKEVVSIGACLLAKDILQQTQDISLPEEIVCSPLQIGNFNKDKKLSLVTVINENEPMPCKKEISAVTFFDNQTSVKIHVFQGGREIQFFTVDNIPKYPKGICKFAVTFEITANGFLKVDARLVRPSFKTAEKSVTVNIQHKNSRQGEIDHFQTLTRKII